MPPAVSYSLVGLTGADGAKVSIARRDLFDARFQLIDGDDDQPLEYIDSPSDLVPGKYEGGFKTWEASHDLAEYLFAGTKSAKGHRVLEVSLFMRGFHRNLTGRSAYSSDAAPRYHPCISCKRYSVPKRRLTQRHIFICKITIHLCLSL